MKLQIPEITDKRIRELSKRIKPLVRDHNRTLCHIKSCNPRTIAFAWSPKITHRAPQLVEIAMIRTLHTYGYKGFFKPSVAEVLAQIPEEHLEETVAFEVIGPRSVSDINEESEALNAGFHVAETRLFGIPLNAQS